MNVNNDTEERYHHSLPIQIRFNDVDRYGHVNNNSYFAYYDLGKEEYLRNVLKMDYRNSDVVPVIANINADFILPIFYGDEIGMEGMGNLANRKPYPWGKEDKELLDFFKVLGNIKKNEKILADADLKILEINNDYILFERNKNDEKIVVGVNRTGDVKIINKQEENELQLFSLNESNSKKLNPHGAFVIKKTKNTTHK